MYSIIDIESNGAGFRKESIIEIAIYKYDGHETVSYTHLDVYKRQLTVFLLSKGTEIPVVAV